MAFFKLKKRCKFCAHTLRNDGTCSNPKCVNYTAEKTAESTTTDSAKKA